MCYHVHGVCVCAPLQVSKVLQWLLSRGVARAPGLEPIPGRLGGFPRAGSRSAWRSAAAFVSPLGRDKFLAGGGGKLPRLRTFLKEPGLAV